MKHINQLSVDVKPGPCDNAFEIALVRAIFRLAKDTAEALGALRTTDSGPCGCEYGCGCEYDVHVDSLTLLADLEVTLKVKSDSDTDLVAAQMAYQAVRGHGGGPDSPDFADELRAAYEELAKSAQETLKALGIDEGEVSP